MVNSSEEVEYCFNSCFDLCFNSSKYSPLSGIDFWLGGVLVIGLACMGLIMNTLIIFLVNSKKDLQTMFNKLLSTLATFDTIFLAMVILSKLLWRFNFKSLLWTYPYISFPVSHFALSGPIGMTFAHAFKSILH